MRLLGQFQVCSFFFVVFFLFLQKDFEHTKSIKDFRPLKNFYAPKKTVPIVVFCLIIFFVGWFWLICVFVCSKSFSKKTQKKQA